MIPFSLKAKAEHNQIKMKVLNKNHLLYMFSLALLQL